MVVDERICEYAKTHRIYLKRIDFMIYELYINKTFTYKKEGRLK